MLPPISVPSRASFSDLVCSTCASVRAGDVQVAPVDVNSGIRLDPNDGKPFLSLETEHHRVTDNMQKHAPPVAPEGKEYILEPEKFAFAFVDPPKYRLGTHPASLWSAVDWERCSAHHMLPLLRLIDLFLLGVVSNSVVVQPLSQNRPLCSL